VGCYIWYSEEGPGQAGAPPSPLLDVPDVTAHPSTASVPRSIQSVTRSSSTASRVISVCGGSRASSSLLCRVQPRDPFVLVRAHVAASQVNSGAEFVVDSWSSCVDVGSLSRRRVDYVQLLVCHSQKSHQLTTFLSSDLDVPVCHAFFVHGVAGHLGLRKFRRLDERHWIESITVSEGDAVLFGYSVVMIDSRQSSTRESHELQRFAFLRRYIIHSLNGLTFVGISFVFTTKRLTCTLLT